MTGDPFWLTAAWLVLAAIGGLYLAALIFGTLRAYRLMFNPKHKTPAYTLNYGLENGNFDPALLELPWEHAKVRAAHRNADLAVSALSGPPGFFVSAERRSFC